MTSSPEYLPDDFAAAIKAADDYADALDTLIRLHDLPHPTDAWMTAQYSYTERTIATLRDAARTFGGQS